MSLGNRHAKQHDTAGSRKVAVNAEDWSDFKQGQTVMTIDGFPGKVTAVYDGPAGGTETYEVELHGGMGGGFYTASQLTAHLDHAAAMENTAARDYPELAQILLDRPDIGKYPESTLGMIASLHTAVEGPMDGGQPCMQCGLHGILSCGETVGKCDSCGNPRTDINVYRSGKYENKPERLCLDCLGSGHHMESAHDRDEADPYLQTMLKDRGQTPIWMKGKTAASNGLEAWHGCMDHNRNHCTDCKTCDCYEGHHESALIDGTQPDRHQQPGLCDNGHLTWGGQCMSCNETGTNSNAMVVNEGDHRPQNVEQIRNAASHSALEYAMDLISEAASNSDLKFQITAAWRDVREKAQRIRSEAGVKVTYAEKGYIIATVRGDHGEYESVIMRNPGTQKVALWDCNCAWGHYNWNPDFGGKHAGRMCSHALALHYEAQTRGLIGRDDRITSESSTQAVPIEAVARFLVASGEASEEVALVLQTLGSVNSPFGEPEANIPSALPGPTMPRDPNMNPASAGPLTGADPVGWSQNQISGLDRMASLDEALFEPEMAHTAGPEMLMDAPELLEGGAAEGEGGLLKGIIPSGGGGGDTQSGSSEPDHEHQGPQEYSNPEGDEALADAQQRLSTLHDFPEPALPSTDSGAPVMDAAMEPDDEQDASGMAISARLGDNAGLATGQGYLTPGDDSASSEGASVTPNMSIKDADDDSLSPSNNSIQPMGSTGSVEDIVAEFQRTAGAQALNKASADSSEIAQMAMQTLISKQGMADFSPAQQAELINEGENVKAANLDRLQIEGTHYMQLEEALRQHDDNEDAWMD